MATEIASFINIFAWLTSGTMLWISKLLTWNQVQGQRFLFNSRTPISSQSWEKGSGLGQPNGCTGYLVFLVFTSPLIRWGAVCLLFWYLSVIDHWGPRIQQNSSLLLNCVLIDKLIKCINFYYDVQKADSIFYLYEINQCDVFGSLLFF